MLVTGKRSAYAILWCSLMVYAAQEFISPSDGALAPGTLQLLTLEPERRAALEAAIAKRDYRGAEELLAEEARRDPKSQAILLALANILFLDSKHLNCAVVLKKAEGLGSLDERNELLLALTYVTLGQLNAARPELEKL